MKNKHLSELFVRGTLHTITDEQGEGTATVFLKKLNLTESEKAVRKANAARAAIIADSRDPDSEAYGDTLADALETSREALVDFIIREDLAKARETAAAEIAAQPEWDDDNFLQGLNDLWADGLNDQFLEDQDDPEAKRVFEALQRFTNEVEAAVEGTAASLRLDYAEVSDKDLRDRAIKQLLKDRADLQWVDIYRKWELVLAVRHADDHKKKYFDKIEDLEDLEAEVLIGLLRAYRELSVEPAEGKDLPETPSS